MISINEIVSTAVDHIGYGPKRSSNDNTLKATRVNLSKVMLKSKVSLRIEPFALMCGKIIV